MGGGEGDEVVGTTAGANEVTVAVAGLVGVTSAPRPLPATGDTKAEGALTSSLPTHHLYINLISLNHRVTVDMAAVAAAGRLKVMVVKTNTDLRIVEVLPRGVSLRATTRTAHLTGV